MHRSHKEISGSGPIIMLFLLLNAIVLEQGLVSGASWYRLLMITVPLLLVSIVANRRKISYRPAVLFIF